MTRNAWRISLVLTILVGMAAFDAAAWGPRAQRAITGTAIQVIRRTYSNAFKSYDWNYEEDVLRGALAGPHFLNNGQPFPNDKEAIEALENEIRLLRHVRRHGVGSYFSFHMGALGALAADIMLPFALDKDGPGSLRAKVEADIDAHVGQYGFTTGEKTRKFIRSAREYVGLRREFFEENRRMIADDYRRGNGHEGYLKNGGQAFFARAVVVAADAWHSVLKVTNEYGDVPPSERTVMWYLIDEMRFLLQQKGNLHQAQKAYADFAKLDPDSMEAYERVGDLFYAFGSDTRQDKAARKEARDRAVREWRIAHDAAGPTRRRIGKKLSDHYITIGEAYLGQGLVPGGTDEDLANALNAFNEALEFDQTNDLAATRINETNVAIAERKEHRQLNLNMIASAQKVMVQAEKARVDGAFGNAIATYNKAAGLLATIGPTFPDQEGQAKQAIREINKNITDIINEVLDAASDAIDRGDKLVDEHDFTGGVAAYQSVPGVLSVIPDDETTTVGKDKRELIDTSLKKIDDAKLAEQRWKELERRREEAARAQAEAASRAPKP